MLDPRIYNRLEAKVKDVYKEEFESKDTKMSNANVLQLLNELEKSLDDYLLDFYISDKIDEKKVGEEWKEIKKAERQKNMKEK